MLLCLVIPQTRQVYTLHNIRPMLVVLFSILSLQTRQRMKGSFDTSLRFWDMFTRTMKYLERSITVGSWILNAQNSNPFEIGTFVFGIPTAFKIWIPIHSKTEQNCRNFVNYHLKTDSQNERILNWFDIPALPFKPQLYLVWTWSSI